MKYNYSIETSDYKEKLEKPIIYKIPGIESTGRDVSISVIDSGYPRHKDINAKYKKDRIGFCQGEKFVFDKNGHSTAISGIIKAKNSKSMTGLAYDANVKYCKVVDNQGDCNFNSLVAAILWSIVANVDIIVIAMGTNHDYPILRDAIKKAVDADILVVAASGEGSDVEYPAKYDDVISVASKDSLKEKSTIVWNVDDTVTTGLKNTYIKVSGSSVSTAFVAGVSACLVENYKKVKTLSKNPYNYVLSRLKDMTENNKLGSY